MLHFVSNKMQEKEIKSKVSIFAFFFSFDKVIREETYVHVECRRESPKQLQSKAQDINKIKRIIRNPTNNSTRIRERTQENSFDHNQILFKNVKRMIILFSPNCPHKAKRICMPHEAILMLTKQPFPTEVDIYRLL